MTIITKIALRGTEEARRITVNQPKKATKANRGLLRQSMYMVKHGRYTLADKILHELVGC